jgi:hypothetical protein
MVEFFVCDCPPGLDTIGRSIELGDSESGRMGKLGGGVLENGKVCLDHRPEIGIGGRSEGFGHHSP